MWYQFTFNAQYENQQKMISEFKNWIKELESKKIIEGFAFNHYFGDNIEDHLSLRFNCTQENLEIIKCEVDKKLFKIDFVKGYKISSWGGEKYVLKAYEVGSRCAFLIWDLIEQGKLSEEYVDNFFKERIFNQIPLQFQFHFFHGLSNSLSIHKYPNEQILRLMALMEWTKSKNLEELWEKLRSDPILSGVKTQ